MKDVFQLEDNILLLRGWMEQYDGLVAGFTTRLGGVSASPFHSNNLGLHVHDNMQDVIINRQRLAERLHFSFDTFTCAEQIHSNVVADVDTTDIGKGRFAVDDSIKGADGIISDTNDVLLVSFYADCVPLFFVDINKKVVALAHAGWKGTVGEIAKETINKMIEQYNCDIAHIRAIIGPAISDCCYEVDEQVINAIKLLWQREKLAESSFHQCVTALNAKKALINLKEINRQIMIKAGILSTHIEVSKLCTSCSTDLFFSHRKEQGKTGRMASFIGWQEREV